MSGSEADIRRRARALARSGEYPAVAELLSEALPGLGHPTDLTLELLEAFRRTGRAQAFVETVWRAIRLGPEPHHIARDAARRMNPAVSEALTFLKTASVLAPDDPSTATLLVHSHEQRREFALALRTARRHEVITGQVGQVVSRRAMDAWQGHRWAAAVAWLKRLVELMPNRSRTLSFLQSAIERQFRERAFPGALPIADLADRLLAAGDRTSILFVGARGEDVETRFRGIPANRLEVVGVDPELDKASDPSATRIALRYLRDVLSDREEDRTFFETSNTGGSSLFGPSASAQRYMASNGRSWGEQLRVTASRPMRTTSVDSIAARGELGRVDSLYVNVQGGELAVLRGGRRSFAQTFAVQVEVSFISHYEGAPDWRAVDAELTGQGFVLIDIRNLMPAGRSSLGFRTRSDSRIGYDRWPSWQLAEAQLLYLRDPLNPAHRTSGRFRTVRDWLVFALWAEYHGQVEIALEALSVLVDDPGLVDDRQHVEGIAARLGPVMDRYRAFLGLHFD